MITRLGKFTYRLQYTIMCLLCLFTLFTHTSRADRVPHVSRDGDHGLSWKTAALWRMLRPWPRTKARARPSSMIELAMRLHSMRSSGSRFEAHAWSRNLSQSLRQMRRKLFPEANQLLRNRSLLHRQIRPRRTENHPSTRHP